jgi:hypothetical protein
MKTSVEGVDARGNRIAYEFAVPADGKDHPVTGVGMPYGSDTIAMIVLDSYTLDATFKKGGTVMGTAHAVMSKDGRTLTQVRHGNGQRPTMLRESAQEATKSPLHSAFHSIWVGMVISS